MFLKKVKFSRAKCRRFHYGGRSLGKNTINMGNISEQLIMTKKGIERLGGRLCLSLTMAAMGWAVSLRVHADDKQPVPPSSVVPAPPAQMTAAPPANPALSPEHTANTLKVARLFRIADGMIDIGSFDEAKAAYNQMLGIDPTNAAARRGLEKAERLISESLRAARDHTRAKMMNEVDAQYELAVPRMTIVPDLAESSDTESGNAAGSPSSKLDSIIYPQITMSETLMSDALAYLQRKAQEKSH